MTAGADHLCGMVCQEMHSVQEGRSRKTPACLWDKSPWNRQDSSGSTRHISWHATSVGIPWRRKSAADLQDADSGLPTCRRPGKVAFCGFTFLSSLSPSGDFKENNGASLSARKDKLMGLFNRWGKMTK